MTTIGMVMGSTSGWDVMKEAAQICKDFGVSCDARALSAHRTPTELKEWMHGMKKGGCQACIAGAGGAANAALSAISMLALNDTALRDKLIAFRSSQAGKVKNAKLPTL